MGLQPFNINIKDVKLKATVSDAKNLDISGTDTTISSSATVSEATDFNGTIDVPDIDIAVPIIGPVTTPTTVDSTTGEIAVDYLKLSSAIESLNNIIENGSGQVKKSLLIEESKGDTADAINGAYDNLKLVETNLNETIQKTALALNNALISFKSSDEQAASNISAINISLFAGAAGIAIGETYIGADGTVDDYANIVAAGEMEELYENGGRVEVDETIESDEEDIDIESNEEETAKSSSSKSSSKHSSSGSSSRSSSKSSSSKSGSSKSSSSHNSGGGGSSSGGGSTRSIASNGSSSSTKISGGFVPDLKIVNGDAEYCSKLYAWKRFGQNNGYVVDFATANGFNGQWSSTVNTNHFEVNLMSNDTAVSYNTLAVSTKFDVATGSDVTNVAYIESVNDGFVYYTDSGASIDPSNWGYVKKVSIDEFKESFDYTLSPIKGVTDFVVSTL